MDTGHPDVSEVLQAIEAIDRAILAQDVAAFVSFFAPDAVVNAPTNLVSFVGEAEKALASGMIHCRSLERRIEYSARRDTGDVVVMGEETFVPRSPHVWTKVDATWVLSVGQATVFNVTS